MPDPNNAPVAPRRETDAPAEDWSAQRRSNGFRMQLFGQAISVPERLVFAAFLAVLLLWVLGAFAKLGWDSPVIPSNGAVRAQAKEQTETLRAVSTRLPASRQEHLDILEELQVTNYVLAECLRLKGECPKLQKPRRLKAQVGE